LYREKDSSADQGWGWGNAAAITAPLLTPWLLSGYLKCVCCDIYRMEWNHTKKVAKPWTMAISMWRNFALKELSK
jgi:hypothetical protein